MEAHVSIGIDELILQQPLLALLVLALLCCCFAGSRPSNICHGMKRKLHFSNRGVTYTVQAHWRLWHSNISSKLSTLVGFFPGQTKVKGTPPFPRQTRAVFFTFLWLVALFRHLAYLQKIRIHWGFKNFQIRVKFRSCSCNSENLGLKMQMTSNRSQTSWNFYLNFFPSRLHRKIWTRKSCHN